MDEILQLLPQPAQSRALQGLYLAQDLRRRSLEQDGDVYIYANFVTSLDGRIAIKSDRDEGLSVSDATANQRDWRLFQELAAQSDLIISSGRYLRDWAKGRAQEILQVDDPRFADLRAWRASRGLAPQPDIAIISGSLRFPIPEVLTAGGRKVVVFTGANSDPQRVQQIEARAGRVYVAGEARVEGQRLAEHFAALGYRTVYSAAGPQILHLLLEAGVLNRLYLTTANRLLGGQVFASVVEGAQFQPPAAVRLDTLYYDPVGVDELGQLFAAYECV
jgi:riboflavin biosynthesis pyrimidine reductase